MPFQARRKKHYRLRKKTALYKNRFFWLIVLFLILFLEIFYLLIFANFFQVKDIEVTGNSPLLTEELMNLAALRVKQKIIVFPSQSIFALNATKLRQQILESYPQINSLIIRRKLPQKILLDVKEREPLALFCRQDGQCFLIDKEAVLFSRKEENEVSRESFLVLTSFQEQLLKAGEKAFSPDLFQKILSIKNSFQEELDITVQIIHLSSPTRLDVRTQDFGEIYFSLENNIGEQIRNLKLVLERKIPPEKRKNLEYIDLRFGNKVYYKYYQELPVETKEK